MHARIPTALIRPVDASREDREWVDFVTAHDFGQLIAWRPSDPYPCVVPLHFVIEGPEALVFHLARPNSVWEVLADNPRTTLAVVGAYTYVTSAMNTVADQPPEFGIPTSYYGAVQIHGRVEVLDDPATIATILNRQRAHFEPDWDGAPVGPDNGYGRHLGAIRGARLTVGEVVAKFKFGGNRRPEHQRAIAQAITARGSDLDLEAARQQLRRVEEAP